MVITDLNNFCMPLIRYRIGDLAMAVDDSPSRVPAAAAFRGSAASRVGCRRSSSAPNGTYMPGTFFPHLFKDYEYAVRLFQVLQHERAP